MSLSSKVIYFVLFVLLLVHPHFITGHIFSLPQAFAQSLVTFVLVGIASVVYLLHTYEIWKKKKAELELLDSSDKLVEAYEYIGTVNRRLPLLKEVTTGVLNRSKKSKKSKKKIIEDLLATATISLAHASWGTFRFVEVAHNRTLHEFVHISKDTRNPRYKIDNKKLFTLRNHANRIFKIDDLYVLSTSDTRNFIQCFFIFPKGENNIKDESPTLQAIVDQAQLLYQYIYIKSAH